MEVQTAEAQGQSTDVQEQQGGRPVKKKIKKSGSLKRAYKAIDANALVLLLTAPAILLGRFFFSVSSGEASTRDIYKLAVQNCFIGLFIAIVFEKHHVSFAAAAGSMIFVSFNYLINPSIEHSDALTDTFKSFRRYSAATLMTKLANLLPLIKVTTSFEEEYYRDKPKGRKILQRAPVETLTEEDELVEDDELIDDEADTGADDDWEESSEEDALGSLFGPPGIPPMGSMGMPGGVPSGMPMGMPPGPPPSGPPNIPLQPPPGLKPTGPPMGNTGNNAGTILAGMPPIGVPPQMPPPPAGIGVPLNGVGGTASPMNPADRPQPLNLENLGIGLGPRANTQGASPVPVDPSKLSIEDDFI